MFLKFCFVGQKSKEILNFLKNRCIFPKKETIVNPPMGVI